MKYNSIILFEAIFLIVCHDNNSIKTASWQCIIIDELIVTR